MKTCIATVSIPGSFAEKISAIGKAGFDAIELFEPDLRSFSGSVHDAATLVRDHGLDVAVFQPFRDFEGRPDGDRATAFEEAERKFDVMQELGTSLLLVCSSVAPNSLGDIDRIVEDFYRLADRAAARGLRVGYEALAWGRHVKDVSQAWDVVQKCNQPNLGLVIDSFHALVRKNDTEIIHQIPGERIFFLQIADAPVLDMDTLQLSRLHRKRPGDGGLDVDSVVRAVLSTNYRGPASLEIFRSASSSDNSDQIAADDYQSLVNLLRRLAK